MEKFAISLSHPQGFQSNGRHVPSRPALAERILFQTQLNSLEQTHRNRLRRGLIYIGIRGVGGDKVDSG